MKIKFMSNKTNQVDWSGAYAGLPSWVLTVTNFVGWIIKIPNFVWGLPGLSKLKGIRLLIITILAAVYTSLSAVDVDILTKGICGIADVFKTNCNADTIAATVKAVMMWLAAALAVEDKSKAG